MAYEVGTGVRTPVSVAKASLGAYRSYQDRHGNMWDIIPRDDALLSANGSKGEWIIRPVFGKDGNLLLQWGKNKPSYTGKPSRDWTSITWESHHGFLGYSWTEVKTFSQTSSLVIARTFPIRETAMVVGSTATPPTVADDLDILKSELFPELNSSGSHKRPLQGAWAKNARKELEAQVGE